jgi:hypothetical protein
MGKLSKGGNPICSMNCMPVDRNIDNGDFSPSMDGGVVID